MAANGDECEALERAGSSAQGAVKGVLCHIGKVEATSNTRWWMGGSVLGGEWMENAR